MSDTLRVIINPFTGAGLPTFQQSELLTHLVQEASEVIKEACKFQSYGAASANPDVPSATNKANLKSEIADLKATLELLSDEGLIDMEKIDQLVPARKLKKTKWLIYKPQA